MSAIPGSGGATLPQPLPWHDPLKGLQLPELVTGEAVVLDLHAASFGPRVLAFALDLLVNAVVLIGSLIVAGKYIDSTDPALATATILVLFIAVLFGAPLTIETLSRGRSLGKLAAGLRVVRDDGGPIRFRQALIRSLLSLFEIYLSSGSIALVTSLFARRGKRLGDLLAGTYVIRERGGPGLPPPPRMPEYLAPWAVQADMAALPDQLSMAVRQFLGRAPSLHAIPRERLGASLALAVSAYVAPSPRGVVHPEDYLSAVLAERRQRDLVRLTNQERSRAERVHRRAGAGVLSTSSTRLVGDE